MLPIYLCDDDKNHIRSLNRGIQHLIIQHELPMTVVLKEQDPAKLLAKLTKPTQGIYFLDVDLKHPLYDGFSLGQRIRQQDPDAHIIFVTTHEELAFETFRYRIGALDYLLKDEPEKLMDDLERLFKKILALNAMPTAEPGQTYVIKLMDETIKIPIAHLLYFETSPAKHRVIAHTTNRQLEFYGNLTEIQAELADLFVRCHRSFLVQKEKIRSFNKKLMEVELTTGHTCLVSRSMKKELTQYIHA